MIEIAPEKVAHIIIKARELGAKVSAWDEDASRDEAGDDPASILEDLAEDSTEAEVASFIRSLNEDEQAELVALAWIGRGTFAPEEFDEAVATAKSERVNPTERYLLGMSLLPDYLEEGMERLGFSAAEIEADIL
jgi:hypothetical protein